MEDGETWLDSRYTLKVELMALLIAQMWGRRGNPQLPRMEFPPLKVRPVTCGGGWVMISPAV